jgi:alpha-N-arabinofuranosidase
VAVDCPSYATAEYGQVPFVDAAATADEGRAALFLVNRSQGEEAEVSVDLSALGVSTVEEAWSLSDPDPHAANTMDQQDRVRLRPNARAVVADGALRVTLPPVSWTAVSLRRPQASPPAPTSS